MSDMVASRVQGSLRQLFGREDDDDHDEFLVRPAATRKIDGLAAILGNLREFADDIIRRQPANECLPSFLHSDDPLSIRDFQQQFMSKGCQIPCLLTRSTLHADWPAGELRWHPRTLLKSLGDTTRVEMKGSNATVTLQQFVEYMESSGCAEDDDPCYLWETLDEALRPIISELSEDQIVTLTKAFSANYKGSEDLWDYMMQKVHLHGATPW